MQTNISPQPDTSQGNTKSKVEKPQVNLQGLGPGSPVPDPPPNQVTSELNSPPEPSGPGSLLKPSDPDHESKDVNRPVEAKFGSYSGVFEGKPWSTLAARRDDEGEFDPYRALSEHAIYNPPVLGPGPVAPISKPSSSINIPISRSERLRQDAQKRRTELEQTQENIRELEKRIIVKGGEIYAPISDISEKRYAEEKEKNLKQLIKALDAEQYLQSRYENELCAFAILRGELAIAKGNSNINNADILAIADQIYPGLFDKHSVLLGATPAHLATKFEDEKLIESEIKDLSEAISAYPDAELLSRRLKSLQTIKSRKEFPTNKNLSLSHTNENLPKFFDTVESFDIEIEDGWYLRISVHMPSLMEQKVDEGIVIRENYLGTLEKVHIAITYYGPWDSGQLNFSGNWGLTKTLGQFNGLCKLCNKQPCEETTNYRFPNCTLFLRLYDETEESEDRFNNRLIHIPFCRVSAAKTMTDKYANVLREGNELNKRSIPDWMFGELFKRLMVGSSWITQNELQGVYTVLKDNRPEKIGFVVHSQIYQKAK